MEKESASGRILGNVKVAAAPAIVTTFVETTTSSTPSTTKSGEEEQNIFTATANEDERNGNANMGSVVAAVLGFLTLGGFAYFWWRQRILQKRSNGNDKDVADVEVGVGQTDECPEMYPTLLEGPSQCGTTKTETKQGLSGSTVSVSTAYASTAGNSINSVSTAGTSQVVEAECATPALPLPPSQENPSVVAEGVLEETLEHQARIAALEHQIEVNQRRDEEWIEVSL